MVENHSVRLWQCSKCGASAKEHSKLPEQGCTHTGTGAVYAASTNTSFNVGSPGVSSDFPGEVEYTEKPRHEQYANSL